MWQETVKDLEQNCISHANSVQEYAVKFLKNINSFVPHIQVEAPVTPDIISGSTVLEMSWEDHLTEVCRYIYDFYL